ncbi:hypothetical protein N7474_005971 [Penicillium riverlandense]|uniref:uncharacterized protein n=1 Tax=Penicillium riverlandense TaxID=1903569 RepID=UPI002547955D|nr:uncharacterized protein N7474_005971 [Penicillium riverlandense]KAJ5820380.1 hypothetical protein N7474_005971 [Penicillium riverlandense]
MSKKILVVFGATGLQGRSVIDYVCSNPDLSKKYAIRAVTRDATKPAAQQLQTRGVEVVTGDADLPESLPAALANAHTVFIVTLTIYDDQLKERELRQTKAMADASVKAGANYLIYSTMVHAERLYGQKVTAFDSKAEGENYIRGLPVKSAFFAPGMFMQNFLGHQALFPMAEQPGVYAFTNFISGDAAVPFIEARADTGKFIGAILASPDKYVDRILCAATRMYSYTEAASIITRVTGRKTTYIRLSEEEWASSFAPEISRPRVAMFKFIEKSGYYGDNSNAKVEWASEQVCGGLTTFEEFVQKNNVFAE